MSEPTDAGRHCPFVNKDDARCGTRLSVADLSYAFGRCFCDYATCPTYQSLLAERQTRRAAVKSPNPSQSPSPAFVTLGLPRATPALTAA